MGVALARVLGDLPDLKALSIQDNRLTDESLGPILRACCNCKALKKLDVGGNKMDEDASEAMGRVARSLQLQYRGARNVQGGCRRW